MKIIKTNDDWILFAEETKPLEILENVYGMGDLVYMKKRISQLLEASISKKPKSTFKKDPSNLVFFSKLVCEAIIGLYLVVENENDFKHLKGKYTEDLIQKIYANTCSTRNLPWQFYPSSLNKKELNDPIKTLKKIKKAVHMEEWLDFIELCVQNCLAFGFEPEWDGNNFQTPCAYNLTKLFDIGYLIYTTETKFGREYVLKEK